MIRHVVQLKLLVSISMSSGDLASASILASMTRPRYILFKKTTFYSVVYNLQTTQEKMCNQLIIFVI